MNRWSKAGVLDRVFARLQQEQILAINCEHVCLDSTTIKVHPDGTGALKKNGPQAIGRSRGGCTTKIHLVAASDRCALILKLSPGQAGDAPAGRELLAAGGPVPEGCLLIMDSAYEGDETLRLARQLGYVPVVPPNPNRASRGNTIAQPTVGVTKSSGFSADSRLIAAFSAASTNSTSYSPDLLCLLSSSKL